MPAGAAAGAITTACSRTGASTICTYRRLATSAPELLRRAPRVLLVAFVRTNAYRSICARTNRTERIGRRWRS